MPLCGRLQTKITFYVMRTNRLDIIFFSIIYTAWYMHYNFAQWKLIYYLLVRALYIICCQFHIYFMVNDLMFIIIIIVLYMCVCVCILLVERIQNGHTHTRTKILFIYTKIIIIIIIATIAQIIILLINQICVRAYKIRKYFKFKLYIYGLSTFHL